MNARLTIALCIVLHAILVLIYAAILATYQAGVYDRPLSLSQDTVRNVITVVSQSFTIAYCAILVLFTQRIASHDFIRRRQTLTAIHDKSSAWLGLGSSLETLVNQGKIVTDLPGVSMITAYLLLIFVVHTTLSGIFAVGTQDITTFVTHSTTLARQGFESQLIEYGDSTLDPHSILSLYDVLNISTVGVSGDMIYDIIPVVANATTTGIEVNATTFSVDCGALPDVVQVDFQPNLTDNSFSGINNPLTTGAPAYFFDFGGGKYGTIAYPMSKDQFQVMSVGANDGRSPSPSMLVVASTYPLVDAAGNNATTVTINPGFHLDAHNDPQITSLYFVGCNFNSQNTTVLVNPQNGMADYLSAPPLQVRWHDWSDPGALPDPLLTNVGISLQAFASTAPPSSVVVPQIIISNASFHTTAPYQSSMIDDFLQMDITVNRPVNQSDFDSVPVTVGELNWSLARAYAAVIWSYNSLLPLLTETNQMVLRQGNAAIPSLSLQERLTINTISLYAGLAASCILFVLTVGLIIRSGAFAKHAVCDDVSRLLPMLWLLGNEPRLAAVQQPDLDTLRAAGMYEVAGLDRHRRRANRMKAQAEEEEHELDEPFTETPRSADHLLVHTPEDTITICNSAASGLSMRGHARRVWRRRFLEILSNQTVVIATGLTVTLVRTWSLDSKHPKTRSQNFLRMDFAQYDDYTDNPGLDSENYPSLLCSLILTDPRRFFTILERASKSPQNSRFKLSKLLRAIDEFIDRTDSQDYVVVLESLVCNCGVQRVLVDDILLNKQLYDPRGYITNALEMHMNLSDTVLVMPIFIIASTMEHNIFMFKGDPGAADAWDPYTRIPKLDHMAQESVQWLIMSCMMCLWQTYDSLITVPRQAIQLLIYFWSHGLLPEDDIATLTTIRDYFSLPGIWEGRGQSIAKAVMSNIDDAWDFVRTCTVALRDETAVDENLEGLLNVIQIIIHFCPHQTFGALHDSESYQDPWAKLLRSIARVCERQLCSGSPDFEFTITGFNILGMFLRPGLGVEPARPQVYGPQAKNGDLAQLDLIPLAAHFTLPAVKGELSDTVESIYDVIGYHMLVIDRPDLNPRLVEAGRRYIGPTLAALKRFRPQDMQLRQNRKMMLEQWEKLRVALRLTQSDLRETVQDEMAEPSVWHAHLQRVQAGNVL
ncbi:hypothetical protein NM688_g1919 [Phlebia brevispora]|uniref:Uncharacterized protein n=1 Tax=Phlebia brevispora TaxID=194682 RepID=A0ACC1T9U9_9APHY|nr:hypothetical protein NM688_g1919 [Phlebia brevispora]